MIKHIAWIIMVLLVVMLNACKPKENKEHAVSNIHRSVKKFTLHLDLSFESSNYQATNPGFVLMDPSGNYLEPKLDTVTKTGGHIDYDTLPGGIYTFKMRTVFDEYKNGKIVLDKNIYESVGPSDVYDYSDSLTETMLAEADSIKVVFAESDFGDYHIFSFFKDKGKYKTRYHNFQDANNEGYVSGTDTSFHKDSSVTIESLIKFQSVVKGLESMEVTQTASKHEPYAFPCYYIKADDTFYSCQDIRNKYFEDAYKKFKNSLFDRK